MGKDNQTVRSLPKSFTRDDLVHVIEQTAQEAVQAAMNAVREAERKKARQSDPAKVAQRMLTEYRRLKIAQNEDIRISEAEGLEMRWKYLEDLMGTPDHTMVAETTMYVREKKLQYNQYKIQRIEAAVDMYRRECENSGNEEDMRRWRTVRMRHMDEPVKTVWEIAQTEHISDKTVYKDLGMAYRVIAVYLSAV